MTTARTIISDALREGGILALGTTPDASIEEEGLRLLNRLLRSTIGNELGDPLIPYSYGKQDISNAFGIAENRQDYIDSIYVPANAALYCNLDTSKTVYLDPNPREGQRFRVADSGSSFGTHSFTVNANGRKIEGTSSVSLTTNGEIKEWFYRGDLGEWKKVSDLDYSDELPFPEEFEDYFSTMLAVRLNPRYGQTMAPETVETLKRARSQLRARYGQSMEMYSELGLVRLPSIRKFYNYAVPMYRFYRGY